MVDTECELCADPGCGKRLSTPLLRCTRCKKVAYCSKKCQISGWRTGHKQACTPCTPLSSLQHAALADGPVTLHMEHMERPSTPRTDEEAISAATTLSHNLANCVETKDYQGGLAMEDEAINAADALLQRRHDSDAAQNLYNNLGICYQRTGQFYPAIVLHMQCKAISEIAGRRSQKSSLQRFDVFLGTDV